MSICENMIGFSVLKLVPSYSKANYYVFPNLLHLSSFWPKGAAHERFFRENEKQKTLLTGESCS
jgi:hypothetical protein